MDENHINFSEQWSKLKDDMFTTIRFFELAKFSYYKSKRGLVFDVRYVTKIGRRGKGIMKAMLLEAIAVQPSELSDAFLDYDTDKNFKGWKDRIKSKPMAIVLIFRKIMPLERKVLDETSLEEVSI